jgi:hypothetical protein
VNCFTPRTIVILMETIKDVYISVGQVPLNGTLGRGFIAHFPTIPRRRSLQGDEVLRASCFVPRCPRKATNGIF